MGNFADALRRIRFEKHMTQEELASFLGTTKQNISRYESGAVSPKISTAQIIANKLGMTLSELNGETPKESDSLIMVDMRVGSQLPPGVKSISELHKQKTKVLGSVAAGNPIYDPEEADVYVDSPVNADAALIVRGDSMSPEYQDGDLVYIKCQPDVPEGTIAVVFLDDEAVLKRVYKRPTGLTLNSENPAFSPLMIEYEDYPATRIFGVPVGYTRIYKKEAKVRKGF